MIKKHLLPIWLAGIVIAAGLISCAETVKPDGVNYSAKRATATASAQGTTEITLEAEDFTLTEAKVRNLPEAGGGKAVALSGEGSSASRTISIAAGSYELHVFIRGTDGEQDAVFVTIAETEYRFYNDDHGVLGPAFSNDGDPVVVSIPANGEYTVSLTFAEPGVLIDRLVLKGR